MATMLLVTLFHPHIGLWVLGRERRLSAPRARRVTCTPLLFFCPKLEVHTFVSEQTQDMYNNIK